MKETIRSASLAVVAAECLHSFLPATVKSIDAAIYWRRLASSITAWSIAARSATSRLSFRCCWSCKSGTYVVLLLFFESAVLIGLPIPETLVESLATVLRTVTTLTISPVATSTTRTSMPRTILVAAAAEFGAGEADGAGALRLARVRFGDRRLEDVLCTSENFARGVARTEPRPVRLLLAPDAFIEAGPLDDAKLPALHESRGEHVRRAARRDLADTRSELVDRDRDQFPGLARHPLQGLGACRCVDARRLRGRRPGAGSDKHGCGQGRAAQAREFQCVQGRSSWFLDRGSRGGRRVTFSFTLTLCGASSGHRSEKRVINSGEVARRPPAALGGVQGLSASPQRIRPAESA